MNIPGVGLDKFNAAYSAGGPDKTLRVVEQLTGLEVNHVVNINFTGFADAVNAIGCVYIDVDRRYYIPPETGTPRSTSRPATSGSADSRRSSTSASATSTTTSSAPRASRTSCARRARSCPPGPLIRDRNELLDIFTEYTTSDIGEAVPLLELLKTFLAVQSAPVREVHFPAELGTTYVTAKRRGDPGGGGAIPERGGHAGRAPRGRVASGLRAGALGRRQAARRGQARGRRQAR